MAPFAISRRRSRKRMHVRLFPSRAATRGTCVSRPVLAARYGIAIAALLTPLH
jgi:hypothetical protein